MVEHRQPGECNTPRDSGRRRTRMQTELRPSYRLAESSRVPNPPAVLELKARRTIHGAFLRHQTSTFRVGLVHLHGPLRVLACRKRSAGRTPSQRRNASRENLGSMDRWPIPGLPQGTEWDKED